MKQTTLIFPKPLPPKEELLEAIQKAFPDAKSKLSFGDYLDIYENDVKTSLDLMTRKIYVRSEFDDLSTKNLLLAAISPARRYTKPYSTDTETPHQLVIEFLKSEYGGVEQVQNELSLKDLWNKFFGKKTK